LSNVLIFFNEHWKKCRNTMWFYVLQGHTIASLIFFFSLIFFDDNIMLTICSKQFFSSAGKETQGLYIVRKTLR
jgi:hypothetical protein